MVAYLDRLKNLKALREATDKTDKIPAYIHRCEVCGDANWGQVGVGYDNVQGVKREYEIWGCMTCRRDAGAD